MKNQFKFSADSASGYLEEIIHLCKKKNFSEANDILYDALKEYPDDPKLLLEMGRHLRSKWLDNEALDCFERAYTLSPDDKFIACTYADFLSKQKRIDEAEIIYLKALDTSPGNYLRDNMFVLVGLGNLYQKTGDTEKAATCFGEAHSRSPIDAVAERRYHEVIRNIDYSHNEEKWEKFKTYIQNKLPPGKAAQAQLTLAEPR